MKELLSAAKVHIIIQTAKISANNSAEILLVAISFVPLHTETPLENRNEAEETPLKNRSRMLRRKIQMRLLMVTDKGSYRVRCKSTLCNRKSTILRCSIPLWPMSILSNESTYLGEASVILSKAPNSLFIVDSLASRYAT